jgi:hypothetical protein
LRIDHAIGEASQPTTANFWRQRMPSLWKLFDELNGLERLDQKGIAQTWRLLRVPRDGFVKLCLRWLQQANVHAGLELTWYFAITSDKATAFTSPRR